MQNVIDLMGHVCCIVSIMANAPITNTSKLKAIAFDLFECTNIINSESVYSAIRSIRLDQPSLSLNESRIVYRLMIKLESNATY